MKMKIILPCLLFVLLSCDDNEFRGYFTSYEDSNTRFEQSLKWNEQYGYSELNIDKNTYALHLMGDSHIGGVKGIDAFFKEAIDKDATAAVLLGDLTSGRKGDYDFFAQHIPSKDSLMYFPIAGNHDLFFDGWKSFYSLFGSSSYHFVINTPTASDLFICLDTGGGTLGDVQLKWFKNLLETKRKNYRYCNVFTHNSLFRLELKSNLPLIAEEVQVLLDLFIRHRVDIVATGHDHEKNTVVLGNTRHIIVDDLKDDNRTPNYLKLNFSEEKIDFSFIEL